MNVRFYFRIILPSYTLPVDLYMETYMYLVDTTNSDCSANVQGIQFSKYSSGNFNGAR